MSGLWDGKVGAVTGINEASAAARRLETELAKAEQGGAIDWPFDVAVVRAVVDAILRPNTITVPTGRALINGEEVRMVSGEEASRARKNE